MLIPVKKPILTVMIATRSRAEIALIEVETDDHNLSCWWDFDAFVSGNPTATSEAASVSVGELTKLCDDCRKQGHGFYKFVIT